MLVVGSTPPQVYLFFFFTRTSYSSGRPHCLYPPRLHRWDVQLESASLLGVQQVIFAAAPTDVPGK